MSAVAPLLPMQIRRSAELSDCGTYRWTLERRWGDGPACLWIMLNPSTATAAVDDPTVRRVIWFSHRWGHPAARIVNLYPFRSPSPAELLRWLQSSVTAYEATGNAIWQAINDNIHRVRLESFDASAIVLAWGADPLGEDREARRILDGLSTRVPHYCLGTTKSGAPLHPMARGKHRVPDDAQPVLWRRPA